MLRALLRLVIVVIVLVAAAAFFLGYRWHGASITGPASAPAVGTTGSASAEAERARDEAARIGEKVGVGAERAAAALEETRLTAKVKSKIALDDTLKGTDIEVHTAGNVVTVGGRVATAAQHQRALQLARETEGVTRVVDRLTVR
jgi:hyperosmotically inducible protein